MSDVVETPLQTVKPANPAAQALGSLGGKVRGDCKRRGDAEYYRQMAKKRVYVSKKETSQAVIVGDVAK